MSSKVRLKRLKIQQGPKNCQFWGLNLWYAARGKGLTPTVGPATKKYASAFSLVISDISTQVDD